MRRILSTLGVLGLLAQLNISQPSPVNVTQVGGTAVDSNSGNKSAGTLRVVLATDQPALTNKLLVTPDTNAQVVPVTTATTTDSASGCYLQSAASTNATNCKASSGNLYGVRAINTTATLYYLRLYNASGTPTCSSATGFIESIPIPASATGAGIAAITPVAIGYSTGIAFCLTGGGSSTDNTNAATGIYLAVYYK
jgi:hypothetical protein